MTNTIAKTKQTLENVPHRLPVDAVGFHGHVSTAMEGQPVRECPQPSGGMAKILPFKGLGRGDTTQPGDGDVFTDV